MALSSLPDAPEKRDAVRGMFDRIAPRYDLVNRLMTMGLDQRWRRVALDRAAVGPGDRVVDLACGTGDLLEQAAARGARVTGVDFSRGMLVGAKRRLPRASLVQADGERLPLANASIDVLTCGFALRNFADLKAAFSEMGRVLADRGRLALLEVDRPSIPGIAALHSVYFNRIVPRIGAMLSDRAAYEYLPESTVYLPNPPELQRMIEDSGFDQVHKVSFLFGAAQLICAQRRPRTG
ncbi:MAG: ubiquinone/menaquinone biosynthesis methyltransferase [bacterium]|nr:ubiquinone/menaquinone biosynthesis methyltransferase [bacterium]